MQAGEIKTLDGDTNLLLHCGSLGVDLRLAPDHSERKWRHAVRHVDDDQDQADDVDHIQQKNDLKMKLPGQ